MGNRQAKTHNLHDKNGTSQTCPNCGVHTGKKTLDVRIHSCPSCNYTTSRDVAAAKVVRNRGTKAVGQIVSTARPAHGEPSSPSFLAENVCRDGLAGAVVTLPSQESTKQKT